MLVAKDALNAQAFGTGPEVLVLIHGFGSDQSVWAPYLPWLSQHYRVITYDLPFAGSADPAYFQLRRHGSVDGLVEDLLDILQSFSVERCSVIGHSLGGLIGLFAAIEQPPLFDRLILLGASARYLDGPNYRGGLDLETLDAMFAYVAANFRDWATSFATTATGKPLDDPTAQTFLASLLRIRPDIAIAMARPIFLGDYRDGVKECSTPVVLLQTKEDPAVPLEAAQVLHQCLKGSTLEIIDAKGHLPHVSAPDAVAAAFRRHLPRLQGTHQFRSCR